MKADAGAVQLRATAAAIATIELVDFICFSAVTDSVGGYRYWAICFITELI